jgi:hypothetical protein
MKKFVPVLGAVASAAGLALALPVAAQTTSTSPAQVIDAEARTQATEVSAVITALDLKNRIVTLKGPTGNEFSVVVDPAVKGLANAKVGDTVAVKYYRALAFDFKKGDGIRAMTVSTAAGAGTKKTMPGVSSVNQVTTVSNIWALDPAAGTVTVRGPLGHFVEVALKDPKLLDGVKVGDQMQMTYTEAVAVAVQPVKP